MNIYLDINGVLLDRHRKPAKHVSEFLKYVTSQHQVFWLSTLCHGGADRAREYLTNKLPEDCTLLLDEVQSTVWSELKTEAIDFSQPFRWLDDFPAEAELEILKEHKATESLIVINLKQDPESLQKLINSL